MAAATGSRQGGRMLTSRTSRIALLTAVVALAIAAWIAPAASADTFCVHTPSDCTGSPQPDLQGALLAAGANGPGKDTVVLGKGSFTDGPAVALAGNPVEIEGAGAEDTTLIGAGNNITVLKLLDAASTVSNLGVRLTGTGGETGIELAGEGSHLKITDSGAQAHSKGVQLVGVSPSLEASSIALSNNPNDLARYAVHSTAAQATIAGSELSALRGIFLAGGNVYVLRSRVWAQQGLTVSSGGYAEVWDTSFRVPGPSPSNLDPIALTAHGSGWGTIEAHRVTAHGSGSTSVGAKASPTAQAGNHATIHIRDSVIDGFEKALAASQSNGATAAITTASSAYELKKIAVAGATYNAAPDNLDLTGLSAGFVDAAGGDFSLRHNSPLVDRGDPAYQTVNAIDRDGHPRVRDGDGTGGPRMDIGALEYQRSAPLAAATATPAATGPGQLVTFEGSASDADPGESPSYHWTFDDGAGAVGASAQHAFATAGTHTATLTVTDPAGLSDSAQATVRVNAPAPTSPPPTAPAPTSPPPTASVFAGVRLVSTRLSFGGRFVALTLRCPAGTIGRCSGRSTLTARRRASSRPIVLGRARFSVAAGQQAKALVRVSRAGRRLLRRAPRLRGRATNAALDGAGRSKTTVARVTIRRRHR
jgi:PKD repeat protein